MGDFSRRTLLIGLPIFALLASGRAMPAADNPPLSGEKRVALQGYDPVSYFTVGRPEKGSGEFQAVFDDATYWFNSAEHRALFVGDPDHYAPQFRGYNSAVIVLADYRGLGKGWK